ncbi:proton-coupled zinc antiporter SLC30A9, mitochondrial-like [Amphiura filiformis]|uniref:proton-coupled zinc antiporter SLC30A9, mitochondrial-like n=1 Tax=Amphiura filiformis TaxID=82378 RepID=UPI003B227E3F
MSATGLPILISKNCVRASQNASRLLSRKETVWLAHHVQQQCRSMFTSQCCSVLHRSFTTCTLQNTVRHLTGQRAIKLSNHSHRNTSKSATPTAKLFSSSKQLPTFRTQYSDCRLASRVPLGSRCLSSKDIPPSGDKSDTPQSQRANNQTGKEEEPIIIKPAGIKASKKEKTSLLAKTKETAVVQMLTDAKKSEEKPYRLRRKKVDYSKKHTENITISKMRAMLEYALKPSDLKDLRAMTRRTPYNTNLNEPPLQLYLRRDVEEKAIEVHGSKEALQREREKAKRKKDKYVKDRDAFDGQLPTEKEKPPSGFFAKREGHVVFSAICINAANFVCKVVAWMYSGSASMFSEAIHSLADTLNQCILAWGIYSGSKEANKDHPYGFTNMPYVSSLISGVAIFCVGAGLSVYHGIVGLIHPEPLESLFLSYCILAGALFTEGATLMIAADAIKKEALAKNMSFFQYVWRSRNPSVNVVLLEDAAAVLGVLVASSCMGLTSFTGNPMYDSLGCIAVGGILASVSAFLIYSNAQSLIWRSIPEEDLTKIAEMMVNDPVVRGVHDVKATVMGVGHDRFKAEIDFDGREVTRAYLDTQDLDALLQTLKKVQTPEQLETFMLSHGEKVIDLLGFHIDRIEKDIKKLNPEIRHVDLEVL